MAILSASLRCVGSPSLDTATLAAHFAGRVRYWDGVNQAFNADGSP